MKTLPLHSASTSSTKYLHKGDWLRILILWLSVMIIRYGLFCLVVTVGRNPIEPEQRNNPKCIPGERNASLQVLQFNDKIVTTRRPGMSNIG